MGVMLGVTLGIMVGVAEGRGVTVTVSCFLFVATRTMRAIRAPTTATPSNATRNIIDTASYYFAKDMSWHNTWSWVPWRSWLQLS